MSQFASLFKTDIKEKAEIKSQAKAKTPTKKSDASLSPAGVEILSPQKTEKRTTGKSSSSDYAQVLTYIKRDTHREVKKALLDDLKSRDLSELVEELLTNWLTKKS
jgi:hypothetical protein